jgi:hypothetical protein
MCLQLWELSNLRRFSFNIWDNEITGDVAEGYTARMLDMLINRCPRLEDLHLFQEHNDTVDLRMIFKQGRWPLLKRLSLGSSYNPILISDPGVPPITLAFFDAHPNLENIFIPRSRNESDMHSNGLPNLRAADFGQGDIMAAVPLNAATNHLEFLSIGIDITSEYFVELMQYLAQIPSLRGLAIDASASENLMYYIVQATPNIEMLQFSCDMGWKYITLMSAIEGVSALCLKSSRPSPHTNRNNRPSMVIANSYPIFVASPTLVILSSLLRSVTPRRLGL